MRYLTTLLALSFLVSCHEVSAPTAQDESLTWTIDTEYLRQGCYGGRDCIPSLESPERSTVDGPALGFMDDNSPVIGIWNGTGHVAYPLAILNWHEIVNEGDYTVSYCPLTGSAIHFDSSSDYGVSGLLFNSNLIMYDRVSGSYWPQMLLKSAAGPRSGNSLHLRPLLETSWGVWKTLFPGTVVINSRTGYSRNYNQYPYGNYQDCNSPNCRDYIYFPVQHQDDRLPAKERVLVLAAASETLAFPLIDYEEVSIRRVDLEGQPHTVVLDNSLGVAIAFKTGRSLEVGMWVLQEEGLTLVDRESGEEWDILGRNLNSQDPADQLQLANGFIAYWFALAAYFPDIEIVS